MAEMVDTPLGLKLSVTKEELGLLRRLRKNKEKDRFFRDSDGIHRCLNCGSVILVIRVFYCNWNSQSSEIYADDVPYCLRCEKKPSWDNPGIILQDDYCK